MIPLNLYARARRFFAGSLLGVRSQRGPLFGVDVNDPGELGRALASDAESTIRAKCPECDAQGIVRITITTPLGQTVPATYPCSHARSR